MEKALDWTATRRCVRVVRGFDEEGAEGGDGGHHDRGRALGLLPVELPCVVFDTLVVEARDANNGADSHEDRETEESG